MAEIALYSPVNIILGGYGASYFGQAYGGYNVSIPILKYNSSIFLYVGRQSPTIKSMRYSNDAKPVIKVG